MSASFGRCKPARWAALVCLAAAHSFAQGGPAMVDYSRQVHPLLATRCLVCHGDEKRSGGLSLGSYGGVLEGGRSGAALKPGNSAESLLVRRINGEMEPAMPLGLKPLTASEIGIIRTWIDQGARATPTSQAAKPRWEPPLKLDPPAIPPAVWPGWEAPADRIVASYLLRRGETRPRLISDTAFARRAYLDAWGLVPSPEELQAFLDDRAPDKHDTLIAKLLAGNQKYAENWISFWNDLLRNDEGVNYAGSRKTITSWLLAALKSNLPYDQLVTKLLNPASEGDPEGFLVGVNWRGDISASQTPAMQAAQNSAQVFLGVNLKCNSCHDSFISRWKLKDAYALAAYFSANPKLEMYRCDASTGQFTEAGFLYPELNRQAASGSLAERRATAATIFTDPRNGRLPRTIVNRVWQRLLGRGIVEPVDDMDAEPWSAELLDWLAGDFVAHHYDLKHLLRTILTSRAYRMQAVSRKGEQPREYVFRGPEVRRMTAEQLTDAIGAITGEWRVYQPDAARPGSYTREWHVASSPLTRALGRPIRDQVVTTRNSEATTLQALELVNGETLTRWLSRGARRILGELPPERTSLFDSGAIRGGGRSEPKSVTFDIDVSKAEKLWLLVTDVDSYAPERVEPAWAKAEFVGPGGITPLSALKPALAVGERAGDGPIDSRSAEGAEGIRVKVPSRLVFDIAGKGFVRFQGVTVLEWPCLRDDINPKIRFFVFQDEPNMERLVAVGPESPVPAIERRWNTPQLVDRVFRHALGRPPSVRERRTAEGALNDPNRPGRPSTEGLADLLWAVVMMPEFQLIY